MTIEARILGNGPAVPRSDDRGQTARGIRGGAWRRRPAEHPPGTRKGRRSAPNALLLPSTEAARGPVRDYFAGVAFTRNSTVPWFSTLTKPRLGASTP